MDRKPIVGCSTIVVLAQIERSMQNSVNSEEYDESQNSEVNSGLPGWKSLVSLMMQLQVNVYVSCLQSLSCYTVMRHE